MKRFAWLVPYLFEMFVLGAVLGFVVGVLV